ncbi:MAG: nuclear transport factor 2 family protein [Nitrospiraceae bacterium]
MTMRCVRSLVVVGLSCWMLNGLSSTAQAVVRVLPDAPLSIDAVSKPGGERATADPLVREVLDAFERAESGVQQQDLEALMQLYAPAFNYHGLHITDVRRIWTEMFEHYRAMSSTHLFSNIVIVREGNQLRAEVTCTGGLYGADRKTGSKITLDSWFEEVHYLVKDGSCWRLMGNRGDAPSFTPASSAPHHPLF